MLAKRIIPCLDVKDGRVVKGVNFESLKDAGSILEQARFYNNSLADELVFLDVSATLQSRKTMLEEVERVSQEVFIPLTVGGGIRSLDDARNVFLYGADKVSINTAAIKNPSLISQLAERYGAQAVVVAIDIKREITENPALLPHRYKVFTHSGKVNTGIDAMEWAEEVVSLGAGEILLTSMDSDGTKAGYELESLRHIATTVSVPVIASGGAGNLNHMVDAFLIGKADAALAASIFHYRQYTIREAKLFLRQNGINVRL